MTRCNVIVLVFSRRAVENHSCSNVLPENWGHLFEVIR